METQVNRTMNCLYCRKKGCKFRNTKFGLTRVSAPKGRFDKPEQCISLSQVTQYVIHKRNIILINYFSLAVPTSSWYSLKTLLKSLLLVVAHRSIAPMILGITVILFQLPIIGAKFCLISGIFVEGSSIILFG